MLLILVCTVGHCQEILFLNVINFFQYMVNINTINLIAILTQHHRMDLTRTNNIYNIRPKKMCVYGHPTDPNFC